MQPTPYRLSMADYLSETSFAVDSLIPAVWHEREEFLRARTVVQGVDHAAWRAYLATILADDPEAMFWPIQTGIGATQMSANIALAVQAATHHLSADSLAGALLQIGKQGLSIVHARRIDAGRLVGGRTLSVVIWEARNQAMHWEDADPKRGVREIFEDLAANADPRFAEYRDGSLAMDVVEFLGWRSSEAFREDLGSLA